MTHPLSNLLIERVATSLKRQSITTPSKWAQSYRQMKNGPWRFTQYPWLREMHDSKAPINVGKKAAQLGYTETVLNIAFYNIDVLARDVLYVLPNRTPDASDFSASRFDPALEMSPHLSNLFSNVKNIGHKRAGMANLYIRGSQSRAGLKSIPVAVVVLDEIEEFNAEAIPLAMERASGQTEKNIWMISTPSVEDVGIDLQFKNSTQEHFFFKCPSCDKYIELQWPDNFTVAEGNSGSFIKCNLCQAHLPHANKAEWLKTGIWVPSVAAGNAAATIRGFYINQLYSPTVTPEEFAAKYQASLTNPADEQEFYNSKLGLTHAVKGARLNDEDITKCIGATGTPALAQPVLCTMGVDVGAFLHYEIDQWQINRELKTSDINNECTLTVLEAGKVNDFEQLDDLMQRYNIRCCVIDAQPERRKAKEFASKYPGRVYLCFYGKGITGKQINVHTDPAEPLITVDRTSWLDLSLSRFRNGTIRLPATIDWEYRSHLRAPIRWYRKDKNGNPVAEYRHDNKPDHYAHARNYAEIALPFAANLARSYDIHTPRF